MRGRDWRRAQNMAASILRRNGIDPSDVALFGGVRPDGTLLCIDRPAHLDKPRRPHYIATVVRRPRLPAQTFDLLLAAQQAIYREHGGRVTRRR